MFKTIKKLLSTSQQADFSSASRNDACPCGSGRKYKICHYNEIRAKSREASSRASWNNTRG